MEEGSLFQRMKQIFHEDEMDRELSLTGLSQSLPVNISLIMGNINTMNIKTRRHAYTVCLQPITRFPTIRIRTNEEIEEST